MRPFTFALCADDYAMAPGVSRGIVEALDAGALSATSVMTNAEFWPEAAPALRPFADRADIGLHLNLTLGRPLGPMPRIAPAGTLPGIGALIAAARRGALPPEELAGEIGRQLDRFKAVMGRPPDHVDGHQHAHVLPPVRRALLGELQARGWTPWLRDSADTLPRLLRRGAPLPKAIGVAVLARGFAAAARRAGFATNSGFAGFSRFDTQPYAASFERYLRAPGPAHLVMCHPGYVDDVLRLLDPVTASRERELALLLSPDFARLLRSREASLALLSPVATGDARFKGS